MFHTSDGRKVIENLDEFDDAREVVSGLAAEYQACEQPDYVSVCSKSHALWHSHLSLLCGIVADSPCVIPVSFTFLPDYELISLLCNS